MERVVVKRVRLTEAEAHRLESLAKTRRETESEVLRAGLRTLSEGERRRRSRARLLAWARAEPAEWKKTQPDVRW